MIPPSAQLHVPPMVGEFVRLDPMLPGDAAGLLQAAHDPATFRWFTVTPSPWTAAGMRDYCEMLIDDPTIVPFTVRDAKTGESVGSSTFCDVRPGHRGIEIGWTFFAPDRRGTRVNPETKLLMLRAAFDAPLFVSPVPGRPTAGPAVRVMLKTHHENRHSQRAIEKLGAVREGVLRNHVVMPDGSLRHTMIYSITPGEWPAIEAGLRSRLRDPPGPT